MKHLKIFLLALTLSLHAISINAGDNKKLPSTPSCLSLGQEQTPSSKWAPGQPEYVMNCCEGLTSLIDPISCLKGAAPGRIICAKCGDSQCDKKTENKCNCSKDCN